MIPGLTISNVQRFRQTDTTNMGDVTDRGSRARFGLRGLFVPVSVRVHFSGGTGQADMAMRLDHYAENWRPDMRLDQDADPTAFDFEEMTWSMVGTGTDVLWRVIPEELLGYVYRHPDQIVFTWTNPDAGNMRWGLEVMLAEVQFGT